MWRCVDGARASTSNLLKMHWIITENKHADGRIRIDGTLRYRGHTEKKNNLQQALKVINMEITKKQLHFRQWN
jgi:hypothetical protein